MASTFILVARSEDRVQEVTDEMKQFGVEVNPLAKDLFDRNAVQEIYDEVASMGININILVNDAGQGQHGKFVETDLQRPDSALLP